MIKIKIEDGTKCWCAYDAATPNEIYLHHTPVAWLAWNESSDVGVGKGRAYWKTVEEMFPHILARFGSSIEFEAYNGAPQTGVRRKWEIWLASQGTKTSPTSTPTPTPIAGKQIKSPTRAQIFEVVRPVMAAVVRGATGQRMARDLVKAKFGLGDLTGDEKQAIDECLRKMAQSVDKTEAP